MPRGSLQSPGVQLDSQEASLHWSRAGSPDQDAKKLMCDILGADIDPGVPEYSTKVAARLQEVIAEQVESDVVRQVDQFAKDSKAEQTFLLLRYAIYLASNNLLPVERAANLLRWIRGSNTVWIVDALVAMRTPTTDSFASALLVSTAKLTDLGTCRSLLKRGVDANTIVPSVYYRGSTALLEAVRQQDGNLVRLLVYAGAEVNMPATSMLSPLFEAVLSDSNGKSYLDIIRVLIDEGADIYQVVGECSNTTILNVVIESGRFHVAAMFSQSNVSIKSFSKQHPTPLQVAAGTGNVKLVEMLLKAGVDVNGRIFYWRRICSQRNWWYEKVV